MQLATTQVTPAKQSAAVGREASRDANYANYSLIGAGTLAITAGMMAFFTDFHGYGEAAPQQR
jgi:hypothetical protein